LLSVATLSLSNIRRFLLPAALHLVGKLNHKLSSEGVIWITLRESRLDGGCGRPFSKRSGAHPRGSRLWRYPNTTAFDAIRMGTSTEDARIELVFGSAAIMCIREPDTRHWFAALSNIGHTWRGRPGKTVVMTRSQSPYEDRTMLGGAADRSSRSHWVDWD
jgi:hypothetical protein